MDIKNLIKYSILATFVSFPIFSMEEIIENVSKTENKIEIIYRANIKSKTYGNGTLTGAKNLLSGDITCYILVTASSMWYVTSDYYRELEKIYESQRELQEEKKQFIQTSDSKKN